MGDGVSTEGHRHACEVRSVVRMFREQGKAATVEFLGKVEKHRGKAARERLEADAVESLRAAASGPARAHLPTQGEAG